MNEPDSSEFAQFRFVRDAGCNIVPLPAQSAGERILLVMDCERWGLARLHIFEGAATRPDKLTAFQEEMSGLAKLRDPSLSRIISWGRDGDELFFADEMRDGEPLPAYLGRTGGIPFSAAAGWILRWLDFIDGAGAPTPSLEQFSTLNFEVVLDRSGGVQPVFSEFHGWTKTGGRVREHSVEWQCAQIFCSLIAGVPIRTFHRDSLPRNFDELDPGLRDSLLAVLAEEPGDAGRRFRSSLLKTAESSVKTNDRIPLPRLPLREWLRKELAAGYEGEPEFSMDETCPRGGDLYSLPTTIRGKPAALQILPGPGNLPREGWLTQHHDATRRVGRRVVQQLQVSFLEDRESITLVGEESVEGVDLHALVSFTGPVPLEAAQRLAPTLDAAIGVLEFPAGAVAIWWLPPENVFLLTGTRSIEGSGRLLERKGSEGWSGFPLKLRLHQTVGTLKDGVNLPSSVRRYSRLPGKQFEAARRSAIAVPLLWFLLTGERFQWRNPAAHSLVPGPLARIFDRFRTQLREDPGEVQENFFRTFGAYEDPATPEETAATDETATDPAASTGEVLREAVHSGEVALPRGSESEPRRGTEGDPVFPVGEGTETEGRRRALPVNLLWLIVAAVVLACVTGYALTGWSFRLGPFAAVPEMEFPLPEFHQSEVELSTAAGAAVREVLLAEGGPQSLRLLPLLDRIDEKGVRRDFLFWLEHLAGKGNGGASRALGLLAVSGGEPHRVAADWFTKGAERGDADSAYRLVALRWLQSPGGDPEPGDVKSLETVARGGHVASQELMALLALKGGDGAAAREWLESASRQGWNPAFYHLGLLDARGIGGSVDPEAAAANLRRAAENGDVRAMFEFGRCLEAGFGIAPSHPEAVRWMKLASSRGHGGAVRWCLDRKISLGTTVPADADP